MSAFVPIGSTAAISLQSEHVPQERTQPSASLTFGQRKALARIRAIEVLPIPRDPVKR
jgi:hypothetical protein